MKVLRICFLSIIFSGGILSNNSIAFIIFSLISITGVEWIAALFNSSVPSQVLI